MRFLARILRFFLFGLWLVFMLLALFVSFVCWYATEGEAQRVEMEQAWRQRAGL